MKRNILIAIVILIGFTILAMALETSIDEPADVRMSENNSKSHVNSSGEKGGAVANPEDSDEKEEDQNDTEIPKTTEVLPEKSNSKSRAIGSGSGVVLEALKGAETTDLSIFYNDTALSSADRVKISAYSIDGTKKYTEVYRDVAIQNSVSKIVLTNLTRHEKVEVEVTIGIGGNRVEMFGSTDVRLRPDIIIQNITVPTTVLSTAYFNVDLNAVELNKDTGANFTVVIKEGSAIIASGAASITGGGSTTVSIPLLISQVGIHNLSAIIENSAPAEDNIENNQQNFNVEITKLLLNQADYTMMYYSQNDDYHNSKNLNTADGAGTHIEVSDYTEKRIVEKFYYKLTINKEIIFPIGSLHIQISNDSGIVEEHEHVNLENETVYYPDTESTLTIISANGLTEIKLERSAKYQETGSSGYNYYSASDNTSWNSGFIDQKGVIMNPRIKIGAYIELIDDGTGYGGLGTMNLTEPVYSNLTWNNGGVTGYRNITTYYTKQAGKTSI